MSLNYSEPATTDVLDIQNNLRILYTNPYQFSNKKREDLFVVIADDKLDIICVTETIPKGHRMPLTAARLTLPDYISFTNFDSDMNNLFKTGLLGISIYVKQSLNVREVIFPSNS